MASLDISQIIGLAQNAGWSGSDLATAVAIALAESSGNPSAYNPEQKAGAAQGAGSYGLWQIYLTAHPQFSAASLIDPSYNASAAFSVYQSAGFSFQPWSTYKSGAYLKYLDQVNSVIAASAPAPDPTATDQTASDGTSTDGSTTTDGSSSSGSTLGTIAIAAGLVGLFLYLRG